MNTAVIGSAMLGAAFLLVAAGCATESPYTQSQGAYTQTQSTRMICRDELVTHNPSSDPHRIVGTATGAALGGLVGNQFGGGNTNKAITAAGVVAGGYAGNQIQEGMQQSKTYTTTERICEPER